MTLPFASAIIRRMHRGAAVVVRMPSSGPRPERNRHIVARTRRKRRDVALYCDILGVLLLFISATMLVSLLTSDSGILGHAMSTSLRMVAGVGAYVLPLVVAAIGVIFLIGPFLPASRNAAFGAAIFFFVIVGWKHLSATRLIPAEDIERFFSPVALSGGGGYAGAGLAYVLKLYLGQAGAYAALFALGVIAFVLLTGKPIAEVLQRAHLIGRDTLDTARSRLPRPERQDIRARKPSSASVLQVAKERSILFARARSQPAESDLRRVKLSEAAGGVGGNGQQAMDLNGEPRDFNLPPTTLLAEPKPPPKRTEEELREKIEIIERTLEEFRVPANVVEIAHGPTVTRYEIQLAPGIKVNKIVSLADNLAMSLAAIDVRVEAPIPGKSAIGVEVPNKNPALVGLREVIDNEEFWKSDSKLTFALGKDVSGMPRFADLAKMPHLLVAGATNAGKSVCLNSLIASLLFRATPDELKFILIDPKRVELSLFDGIPHLCHPVVRDARMAAGIFRSAVKEMERRYDLLARVGVRNIDGYNEKVGDKEKMPYLVLIVDELADLMMQAAAEIETQICRIAQLARATGIHLVIATQRPSVDVVTGLIKANISSRIAFAVSAQVDSRTILDMNGAERLIGRGDMLFMPIDASKPMRVQGCFVSEKEIEALCTYLKNERKPEYTLHVTEPGAAGMGEADGASDEIYEQAVRLVVQKGFASTSMLQRRFKVGYTRAARVVDAMEQQGLVGPLDGAKPREVLVTPDEVDELFVPREVREFQAQRFEDDSARDESDGEADESEEDEES